MWQRKQKPDGPRPEDVILQRLEQENDFMTSTELVEACGLAPGQVIRGTDRLYSANEIMQRFRLGSLAIIVTVEEVRIPEVGFNKHLLSLLKGIGASRDNWTQLQVDYAARSEEWPDFLPQDLRPLMVYTPGAAE